MAASKHCVIVAPATPMGPAPRAVIRISGTFLFAQAEQYLAFAPVAITARRQVLACRLEPLPGVEIDAHLLLFPGPFSATGEDLCEIHMPSAPPLVEALIQQVMHCGARLAEPGEFTRRAFLNGRLDLTQAEAVLELVEARSSAAALAATQVLGGSLGSCMSACRDVLLEALLELEAGLDFEEGDSQDLEPGVVDHFLTRAQELLDSALQAEQKRMLRHGGRFRIGLFGAANAGKTTLFSRLTNMPSLISKVAGTTRDRREGLWHCPQAELPLSLVDYPGLGGAAVDVRDAAARSLAQNAQTPLDLLWLCVAPGTLAQNLPTSLPAVPRLVVWTQSDRGSLPSAELRAAVAQLAGPQARQIYVACPDNQDPNLAQLSLVVGETDLAKFTWNVLSASEKTLSDHIAHGRRHQEALREALGAVARAAQWDQVGGHQDLVAEELRAALAALALLVGEFTPEQVLDRLFAAFCIGK